MIRWILLRWLTSWWKQTCRMIGSGQRASIANWCAKHLALKPPTFFLRIEPCVSPAPPALMQQLLRAHKGPYGPIRAHMGPFGPIWPRNIRNLLRWGGWRDTTLKAPIQAIFYVFFVIFQAHMDPLWARPGPLKSGKSSGKSHLFFKNMFIKNRRFWYQSIN